MDKFQALDKALDAVTTAKKAVGDAAVAILDINNDDFHNLCRLEEMLDVITCMVRSIGGKEYDKVKKN